jgi:hypothetical protein
MAAAKFAKQMLHMPGVGPSSPPLVADTFQMAQTNDNFHLKVPTRVVRGDYQGLTLAAWRALAHSSGIS